VARRVALATSWELPDLEPDSRALLRALGARGVDVEPVVWTDSGIDWSSYDMVVIRNTWDYSTRLAEFEAWVDRVDSVVPLWNPAPVVHWNAHKRYLTSLAAHGVPVVETLELPAGSAVDLVAVMAEHDWADAVFKPAVSASARGLVHVQSEEQAREAQAALDELLRTDDVLLQPFLPAVIEEGELSLMYLDGELSHAVIKRPAHGDIRVQDEWGGVAAPVAAPPPEAVELAGAALATVDAPLLYARADLVRGLDGELRVIELELIEPSLFFELHEPAAPRLADAIVTLLEA
jgi:glutathione synthase/RimK-type ligase-like ATP-grasp enzyme